MSEADDRCTICYKPFVEGAEDKVFCLNCREYFCPRCFGEVKNGQCQYCEAAREAIEKPPDDSDDLDNSCLIF